MNEKNLRKIDSENQASAKESLRTFDDANCALNERFEFRSIRPEESERVAEIEQTVFPPNEAASPEHLADRIRVAPDLFLVAVDRSTGEIAGFLNGLASDEPKFRDEFFTDASLHDPDGGNVLLMGLDVSPEYQKQGLARELVNTYCRREQARGRKKLILTCLPNLVNMYFKMGFSDRGMSASVWGGEAWHEMDLTLNL